MLKVLVKSLKNTCYSVTFFKSLWKELCNFTKIWALHRCLTQSPSESKGWQVSKRWIKGFFVFWTITKKISMLPMCNVKIECKKLNIKIEQKKIRNRRKVKTFFLCRIKIFMTCDYMFVCCYMSNKFYQHELTF